MSIRSQHGRLVLLEILACLLIVSVGACAPASEGRGLITVASTEAPQQVMLGKMLVLVLREAGLEVDDRTALGDQWVLRAALEAGSVDVAWQYTGETWVEYLGHDLPISNPEDAFHQVRDADALRQITWLAMAPYERPLTLLMLGERAGELELSSMSDLASYMRRVNPDMRLCTPEDVYRSPQGVRGLERVYRFDFRLHNVRLVPFERGYDALVAGECDCALGRLADAEVRIPGKGQIAALADDRGFFQASNLAPVVRTETLQQYPDLEPKLNELSRVLTRQAMVELDRQMANKRANPEAVARRFLKRRGILKGWDPFPIPTPTPSWLGKEDQEDDARKSVSPSPSTEDHGLPSLSPSPSEESNELPPLSPSPQEGDDS